MQYERIQNPERKKASQEIEERGERKISL